MLLFYSLLHGLTDPAAASRRPYIIHYLPTAQLSHGHFWRWGVFQLKINFEK